MLLLAIPVNSEKGEKAKNFADEFPFFVKFGTYKIGRNGKEMCLFVMEPEEPKSGKMTILIPSENPWVSPLPIQIPESPMDPDVRAMCIINHWEDLYRGTKKRRKKTRT